MDREETLDRRFLVQLQSVAVLMIECGEIIFGVLFDVKGGI